MTEYHWQGRNQQGIVVTGTLDMQNVQMVKAWLRLQGITPYKINKQHLLLRSWRKYSISRDAINLSLNQLGVLLSAGISLTQCLEIVAKGLQYTALRHCFFKIKKLVESGHSLSQACQQYPQYFNHLFCSFISIGENTGRLDEMIKRATLHQEKILAVKNKVLKSLYYPCSVMIIGIIVTIIIMRVVVPQFEALFNNAGSQLPYITQLVISFSRQITHFGNYIFSICAMLIVGIVYSHHANNRFAILFDKWILKIPIVGSMLKYTIVSRISQTLSISLTAGLPILDALNLIAHSAGNLCYQQEVLLIRQVIIGGSSLNQAMQNSQLFPSLMIQLIAIGEEAGKLEQMLTKIADYYEALLDNKVNGLSSLIEPVIMSLLGIIIGTLIIAMYLPIFKLGAVL